MEPLDREAVFRSTITIEWIEDYLENRMSDPLGYHKLLCMTHSDRPTHSKRYQRFLYKLPPIKCAWDWKDDHSKQSILSTLREELQLL